MANETSATYFDTNAVVDKTAAGTFIPEIWSDEIIAAYQKNLKMAPLVKRLSMTGKKGDIIHVPKPTRGTASAKSAATGNARGTTEGSRRKTYRRADIIKLMQTDPDRYMALQPEIMAAYAEGRVK